MRGWKYNLISAMSGAEIIKVSVETPEQDNMKLSGDQEFAKSVLQQSFYSGL